MKLPHRADHALARIVTVLAACVALTVSITLPAAYFLATYTSHRAEEMAEAKLATATVSQLVGANPELWVFENARIRGLLALLGNPPVPERLVVTSAAGEVVAERGLELPHPLMLTTSPIYDSGNIVGYIEIQRSLRRPLLMSLIVALFSSALGAVAFAVLRSVPLRLLKRALARSTHLATHDTLTGLPNRALFRDRIEQSLAWSRREGESLAVLYLDLDRFKDVNDTLGHGAGDRLLVEVAARLGACVRETDALARLGGDEFAVVQVSVPNVGDVELLAQRLITALDQPFDLGGSLVTIGVSIGIATRSAGELQPMEVDAGVLLQEADVALYRAKEEGRDTYRFFSATMNRRLLERRAMEAALLEALQKGQFRLRYQPQFDLTDHQVVGAEALLRWQHPIHGEVSPDSFILIAEESGLILPLGEWVLQEACRQAVAWPGLQRMAVNVSPVQFRRVGFFDQVQRALLHSGLDPSRLEIEITEGVLLHDTDETLTTLRQLRGLGVAIAMDDFGTGYSSLGYLQKFHFDKIKIDRSFVCATATDPHAAAIVRAVLRMSHAMGIRVNAEGVEHEEQATLLREEGCEEVQGFLFGRALQVGEFSDLLAQDPARKQREPATA